MVTAPTDGAIPARLHWWRGGLRGRPEEWSLDAWSAAPIADWSPAGGGGVYATDLGAQGDWCVDATDGHRWEPPDLQAARFGPGGRLWILSADRLIESIPPTWTDRVVWRNGPERAGPGMVARCLAVGRGHATVGLRDGTVVRIDLRTGTAAEHPLLGTLVAGLAVAPAGGRIAGGGEGGEVRLLDPATGTVTAVPDAHRGAVRAVACGRQFLVNGADDRRVRLWTWAGEPVATLRMTGPVRQVLLSADESPLLVLVEGERAVRRWRLDTLTGEWAGLGLDPGLSRR